MRGQRHRETAQSLLTAAPLHAVAIWGALPEHDQRAITTEIARAGTAESPHTFTLHHRAEHDPIAALALAARPSNDAALRGVGITALQSRTDALRAIWMHLPPTVQTALRMHPDGGIAGNGLVAPP